MEISKSTFYRNMRDLRANKIVTKTDSGYSIDSSLFYVPTGNEIIERYKKELEKRATSCPAYKQNRVYETFFSHYNACFTKLKMPKALFPSALESGTFFSQIKGEDSKRHPTTSFQF